MLPEMYRETKNIEFRGKQITIKKMMVQDAIKLSKLIDDKENVLPFISDLADNVDVTTLTKAELYQLYCNIAEFTNGHGLQFPVTCDNEKCNLKTPFKVELLISNVKAKIIKKQTVDIDDISFNFENLYNNDDTVNSMLKSVIYKGKLYKLEKDEIDTFLNEYITLEQYNRMVEKIEFEELKIEYVCPACGKVYTDNLLNLDFFA